MVEQIPPGDFISGCLSSPIPSGRKHCESYEIARLVPQHHDVVLAQARRAPIDIQQ